MFIANNIANNDAALFRMTYAVSGTYKKREKAKM